MVGNRPGLEEIAFSGDRALSLLARPEPAPVCAAEPIPGHVSLWVAPPFTGKTSLALWNAMARAGGCGPWEGTCMRERGRVLIYSLDEAVEQVVRRMAQLAEFHPAGPLKRYVQDIVILGVDRDVEPGALDGLRFDEDGLITLAHWLDQAEREGRPFRETYIDAYADVLPLGESENSNEEAARIGGGLEALAVRTGCAFVLLHHTGKPRKEDSSRGDLPDLRYLSRGASALAQKARTVMALEEVSGSPHLRRVRTRTNLGGSPKPKVFQVADNTSSLKEDLLYFHIHDPLAKYDPSAYLAEGPISTTSLAWALSGRLRERNAEPPGDTKRLAAELRDRWLDGNLVTVIDGPRGARMIQLVEGPVE